MLQLSRPGQRAKVAQVLTLKAPAWHAYVSFTSEDRAVLVSAPAFGGEGPDEIDSVSSLSRDEVGSWSASEPVPIERSARTVRGMATEDDRALLLQIDDRDRRLGSFVHPIDNRTDSVEVGEAAVHLERATLWMYSHPELPRAYLATRTDERDTRGVLHVLEPDESGTWSAGDAPFPLPNLPERMAIAPDGSFAIIAEPQWTRPADGEPMVERWGLDELTLDADGQPVVAREGVGTADVSRVTAMAIGPDEQVVVGERIRSGAVEYRVSVYLRDGASGFAPICDPIPTESSIADIGIAPAE